MGHVLVFSKIGHTLNKTGGKQRPDQLSSLKRSMMWMQTSYGFNIPVYLITTNIVRLSRIESFEIHGQGQVST